MEERNITGERDNGGAMATFSLVAVLVIVALIGLFVWQPWNQTSTTHTTTNSSTPNRSGGTY
jgi:hypothetical protein